MRRTYGFPREIRRKPDPWEKPHNGLPGGIFIILAGLMALFTIIGVTFRFF